MTGEPGFHSATIEVPPAEAAAGTIKAVWSPTHGAMNVAVPPGTVDGTVIWVDTPSGRVAVTIRVTMPFMPPPGAPYPPQPFPGQQQYPGQPFGLAPASAPAAPGKSGRGTKIIGFGVAALLAIGCFGVVRAFTGGDDDDAEAQNGTRNSIISSTSPKPGSPSAAPISPQAYAQLLTGSDTAIKAAFSKLNTSSSAAFTKAAPAAASTLRAEAAKLLKTTPPDGAAQAHVLLATELQSLGTMVQETGETKGECPAASPYTELLRSGWADNIRKDAKKLAGANASYKFGSFLPAAPKEQKRRLKTGTYVKRASGGLGHLKIENGADDTTISLVPVKGAKPKPIMTVYVRGGGSFTAKGIKDGTYRVFSATGEDYDKARKGFTRDCSFSKFDDSFKFSTTSAASTIWTITLTPSIAGNASTSDVDPNAFPQ
ncbi:hypothetical protein [Actinoplanes sp. TFC3]|uniref:hypothetical protein n=1 Tax=Actinoplanes sp. TFC3 TaxID=1710355 RepID=UPI000831DC0D|nr:hypothetical protein [Actinoplanes sp. TFC3]